MIKKIAELEKLASDMVGDGQTPDLFFVTDRGGVVTVTTDFEVACLAWEKLRDRYPLTECALENRHHGVVASVEPDGDGGPLIILDDRHQWAGFQV